MPELKAFSSEKRVPYGAGNNDGKELLSFNANILLLAQLHVRRPTALKPLAAEISPKPTEPAASVYSSRFWAGVGVDLRKKERPFHLDRKSFHRARSLKNSLLSLMWWKRLGTPLVKLIARCRKVLPGTTTLHANWRVPINQAHWPTIFEAVEQLIDSDEFVLG